MYVLEQYLINVSSVGWTNATQPRDIVSLLRGQNQKRSANLKFKLRHHTEGREDLILLPSVIPAQVQGRHNTMRSTHTIWYPFQRQCRQAIMEGIGDTIQTLEASGQDPWLQWCQLVRRQEESGTSHSHIYFWCRDQDWQLQFRLETGKD